MIPLQRLRQLTDDSFNAYMTKHGHKMVRIFSHEHGAYWGIPGIASYHVNPEKAEILTLKQAFDKTCHCGPEKRIHYEFVNPMMVVITLSGPPGCGKHYISNIIYDALLNNGLTKNDIAKTEPDDVLTELGNKKILIQEVHA